MHTQPAQRPEDGTGQDKSGDHDRNSKARGQCQGGRKGGNWDPVREALENWDGELGCWLFTMQTPQVCWFIHHALLLLPLAPDPSFIRDV